MAGLSITLEDQRARAMLSSMSQLLRSPLAPLTQAGQVAARLVRNTFQAQRDPWGRAWTPWAPATRRSRRRASGANILLRTFRLFRSIDYRPATADGVEVTAGAEYASYHQFGAGRLPQRAFFPLRSPGAADIPRAWWVEILAPVEAAIAREART